MVKPDGRPMRCPWGRRNLRWKDGEAKVSGVSNELLCDDLRQPGVNSPQANSMEGTYSPSDG